MRERVLGVPVDILSRAESLKKVTSWLSESKPKKLRMLATAYSEFFVNAQRDKEFYRVLNDADLVTPDGRSVLAAVTYGNMAHGTWYKKILDGLTVGRRILTNDLGESVTGVWLFEKLCEESEKRGWKVFVLGGWGDVNKRATRMLLERFPRLRLDSDPGKQEVGIDLEDDKRVVAKINRFKPDLLFVQYRPIQQEKWIDTYKDVLKARVAIGIGGTLDEFVGDLELPPVWMERMGLKWLWRLYIQPKRWKRMIDAVIIFPWLVFKESLRK